LQGKGKGRARQSRAPGDTRTVQGTGNRPGTPEGGPDLRPDLREAGHRAGSGL